VVSADFPISGVVLLSSVQSASVSLDKHINLLNILSECDIMQMYFQNGMFSLDKGPLMWAMNYKRARSSRLSNDSTAKHIN